MSNQKTRVGSLKAITGNYEKIQVLAMSQQSLNYGDRWKNLMALVYFILFRNPLLTVVTTLYISYVQNLFLHSWF